MVHLLVLMFIVWRVAHVCHAFPVHNVGHQKDVTTQTDKREHLLCWVVHIMTHSKCAVEEEEEEPDGKNFLSGTNNVVESAEHGSPSLGAYVRANKCGSSLQSEQHANEIASELGLVVVRVFKEFHDHYLMCHINERLNSSKSSSTKISYIQQEHATLKSQDADAFLLIKNGKHNRMSTHHEVLHFSQEFAFKRHSRRFLNEASDDKMFAVLDQTKIKPQALNDLSSMDQVHKPSHSMKFLSNELKDKLYNRTDRRIICHDVFKDLDKSSVKDFASNLSLSLRQCFHQFPSGSQNVLCDMAYCYYYPHVLNSSSFGSVLEPRISLSAFCTLVNNHLSFLASLLNKTDHPYFLKSSISSITFTVLKHIHALFSPSLTKKQNSEGAIDNVCEAYAKLFAPFQNKATLNVFFCHLMKILLCPLLHTEELLSQDLSVNKNLLRDKLLSSSVQRNIHVAAREQPGLSVSSSLKRGPRIERSSRAGRQTVMFNDPAFPLQWHLLNRVTPSMDINVTGIWSNNYTGHGVTVAVVDDGVEWRNPDLKLNYNYHGSWDLNDDDPDPTPSTKKLANHHGTRCAGEIAAVANNKVCGVGVAYDSQISGLRVLDGIMTDSLEAEAFNKKMDVNDIYSCSWGPDDDGKTVDGPHLMAAKAMKHGVDYGRKGYGSIFVVASGNGGSQADNCNFDGYANSIYTVTIGAVDENGGMPYYAEECASMLGVTFSSGMNNKRDIVTTDWMFKNSKGCTEGHTGTSAAAPLAAGMIALMLSARPCLTWRDVQYVLILTARKVDVDLAHWQKNGAGLSHSHKHGFGLLSAWRMVNAARVWQSVPWMTSFSYTADGVDALIPKGVRNPLMLNHLVQAEDVRGYGLSVLESVQVTVWLTHPCRGKLGVKLKSPRGTVSVIAAPRRKDNSTAGFQAWTFTTVRNWGESPVGNWTLAIMDMDLHKFDQGKLSKWRLTLFGTPMTPKEFQERRRLVESAMSGQFLSPNHTMSCTPPHEYKDQPSFMSEKALKILVLASAFCLVMALYETLEYLFCYGDEKKEQAREMKLARRALRQAGQSMANADNRAVDPSLSDDAAALASDADSASASLLSRDNFNDAVANENDDDDEEDDIFDASETQGLLSGGSRDASENAHRLTHHPLSNGRVPTAGVFSDALPRDAIPMSTFSVSSAQNTVNASTDSES